MSSRNVVDRGVKLGLMMKFGSVHPAATEKLTEDQLAALVTRDAMIGVAKVTLPPSGGNA